MDLHDARVRRIQCRAVRVGRVCIARYVQDDASLAGVRDVVEESMQTVLQVHSMTLLWDSGRP